MISVDDYFICFNKLKECTFIFKIFTHCYQLKKDNWAKQLKNIICKRSSISSVLFAIYFL